MGIILGALAGAGDYIAKSETQNQKRMDDMDLEKHRSDLEMRKLKMLDSLRERSAIATEQRAEAPLKRFGTALAANQQGEVPVTAAPVSNLSGGQGQNTQGNALKKGFTGDLQKVRADIVAMPDGADKDQAMQQLQSQFAAETATANKGIIGQTRKMTSSEALNKTLDDTLTSDPLALTAYQKNIGNDLNKAELGNLKLEFQKTSAAAKNDAYLQNVQAKLDMAANKLDMAKTIAEMRVAAGAGGSGGDKDPANVKTIEYLVTNGTPRDKAIAMVLGDNEGKTKDPVALAAQLAATMIKDGVRVPKDAPAGTTSVSYAMDMATQQIELASKKFRPDSQAAQPSQKPAESKPAAAPAAKPAAPAPAAKTTSPYAEGTKLTGPGGKPYIVRNGKPEPV